MRKELMVGVMASSLALAACEEGHEREQAGTLIGAAAGALLGSAVSDSAVLVAVGAVAGAYLGGQLGRKLDERDRQYLQTTTQNSLTKAPAGQTSRWANPDSGNSGTITPQKTFKNTEGQDCREFQQSVTVSGQTETGYGTACRQADGTWRVVKG